MTDWTELPPDVLAKIVARIERLRASEFSQGSGVWTSTLKSLSAVCRSWRRVRLYVEQLRPGCSAEYLPDIVSQFPNLESLDLRRCRPSGVVSWDDISTGRIEAVPMTEFSFLIRLKRLRGLEVHHIGDEELLSICRLTGLRSLTLGHYPRMTPDGVRSLTVLGLLTALTVLSDGRLNSKSYGFLSHLRRLRLLRLRHCNVDDAGLEAVRKLSDLRSLHLSSCHRITANGLDALPHLCRLTELDLSDTGINDDAFSFLVRCSGLRRLNLSHCCLPLAHDRLILLQTLPLERLILIRCEGVSWQTVAELKGRCQSCCIEYQEVGDALKERVRFV